MRGRHDAGDGLAHSARHCQRKAVTDAEDSARRHCIVFAVWMVSRRHKRGQEEADVVALNLQVGNSAGVSQSAIREKMDPHDADDGVLARKQVAHTLEHHTNDTVISRPAQRHRHASAQVAGHHHHVRSRSRMWRGPAASLGPRPL
jgi:hypothetical protein